jgi:hypothetical protein
MTGNDAPTAGAPIPPARKVRFPPPPFIPKNREVITRKLEMVQKTGFHNLSSHHYMSWNRDPLHPVVPSGESYRSIGY